MKGSFRISIHYPPFMPPNHSETAQILLEVPVFVGYVPFAPSGGQFGPLTDIVCFSKFHHRGACNASLPARPRLGIATSSTLEAHPCEQYCSEMY
jgi:hypothetical protein